MSELAVAFLGDVVGAAGRRAVAHAVPKLRERVAPLRLVVIANGENSRNGSGISPDNYRELRRSGVDAVTLGDHVYKDRLIVPVLENPGEPIARPANLAAGAPGKRVTVLVPEQGPPIAVLTVLGRLYMPLLADNPFEAVDRELAALPQRDAIVFVEIHAEATSEKQALAWHCLEKWSSPQPDRPRVVCVVGSHTHVQTADARLLDHSVAAITDLGMSGPHRSVIGRDVAATLQAMVRQAPSPLDVASTDVRACGVLVRVDTADRRPLSIEPIEVRAPD